jgi:hypothetical protein
MHEGNDGVLFLDVVNGQGGWRYRSIVGLSGGLIAADTVLSAVTAALDKHDNILRIGISQENHHII